jgi:hypothetical protein
MNRQISDFPRGKSVALDTLEITSELYLDNLALNQDGKVGFNLKKRAHSKALNTSLFGKLLYINSNLHEQYQDTFYCSHSLQIEGDKAKSNFCRKRWCMICNRIRTAQLINAYKPTLDTWQEKEFVTLTVKNMPKNELPTAISKMYKSFTKLKDSERKAKENIVGIRKLEVTYNKFSDEYHPHFHLIIQNQGSGERIIDKWLKLNTTAERSGQDVKKADDNSSFELFKYFTKLTSNSKKDKTISLSALDTIFNSIQGVRTFQPFGFIAHKQITPPENLDMNENLSLESQNFIYETKIKDWLSIETGEILTGYLNNSNLEQFEKKIISPNLFEFQEPTEPPPKIEFPDTMTYLEQFENSWYQNNKTKN